MIVGKVQFCHYYFHIQVTCTQLDHLAKLFWF